MSDPVTVVCRSPIMHGGTERVVYLLGAALRRTGVDADILLLANETNQADAEETQRSYEADGIPTHFVVIPSKKPSPLLEVSRLRALFRHHASKVVNIHYSTTHGPRLTELLALRLAGKRCVVSLHHPESLDHLPWKNRAVISAALHLAHEVVVTTPYVQEVLTALPGRLHEVVIPLGIPAPSTAVPGPDLRATLGVPDDAFVIGYLGRLVEYKGLPLLVDAVAAMGGRPMLLVAGDGPEGATIKAEAEQLLGDRVHFLGAVPDRDAFYQALNVFAMPSSLEGFGLAYVEAALHGIPSVASPAGGVPYVVLDKKTGLVVEQTASAVAGALERLHSDPGYARALGERARQHALEQFTDTVMANHYALLFRS